MSVHFVAFLIGLFGVPIALLAYGHRLRRRTDRQQRVFWGAVVGHCVAGVLAVVWGMIPPEEWTSGETARGLAGYWALFVLPAAGALVGALTPLGPRRKAAPTRRASAR